MGRWSSRTPMAASRPPTPSAPAPHTRRFALAICRREMALTAVARRIRTQPAGSESRPSPQPTRRPRRAARRTPPRARSPAVARRRPPPPGATPPVRLGPGVHCRGRDVHTQCLAALLGRPDPVAQATSTWASGSPRCEGDVWHAPMPTRTSSRRPVCFRWPASWFTNATTSIRTQRSARSPGGRPMTPRSPRAGSPRPCGPRKGLANLPSCTHNAHVPQQHPSKSPT